MIKLKILLFRLFHVIKIMKKRFLFEFLMLFEKTFVCLIRVDEILIIIIEGFQTRNLNLFCVKRICLDLEEISIH